ncbi:MAG: hypothetical protein OXH28_06600 [bacterium]|nr:hypothetical protein [bacterium]
MALLALMSGAVVAAPVAAQDSAGDLEVRIVARKLANGKVEFGLQQRRGDNSWGERQLPQVRLFPTTATVDRWLVSSALDLTAGDLEVRIVARKLANGKIEFGLQQRRGDNSWGERQLPQVRLFPTTATVDRWLVSSPLTLTATQAAPAEQTTPTPPQNHEGEDESQDQDASQPPATTTTEPIPSPLPPNSDYWNEVLRIEAFIVACGLLEGEHNQCHNHPEDTQTVIRDLGNLHGCEWDLSWGMCVGQSIGGYLFMLAQLACSEEGWYFDVNVVLCYHPDYPREEGEWVSGRWMDYF